MPLAPLFFLGVAVFIVAACDAPARREDAQKPAVGPIQLAYHVQDQEKVVDWQHSPEWESRWQDSLVAQLERGAIPALDQDNHPLPTDSLRRARRLRGVVLVQDENGALQDGVLRHPPGEVRAYVTEKAGRLVWDLYFYDRAVALELFYARVPVAAVEKLTGRPLVLARVSQAAVQ